jgi:iron complex transport system substrate-binding protein
MVGRARWLIGASLLVASCGGRAGDRLSTSTPDAPASSVPATAAPVQTTSSVDVDTTVAEAAFPVELAHRHGTTTIDGAPERVVTVGLTDQDPLLALGVVPVGTMESFGGHPGAVWPWAQDELGDAPIPQLVGDTSAVNFEQIAALESDLILAVYSGLSAEEYATLSAIAPTAAQPDEYVDWGVPWEEQTRTIGTAVGRAAEADALVEEVEARFDTASTAHPEFAGSVGVVATPYVGSVFVYSPQDPRG